MDPITCLCYNRIQKPEKTCIFSDQPTSAGPVLNQKVNWSRISDQVLKEKYHGPLSVELATFDPFYHNDIEKASQVIHNFTEQKEEEVALPAPPILFERQILPQQAIYRWKRNLTASRIHFKYWKNILISRFY